MILVDDQSGSSTLFPYIKALTPDCVMTRIDPPFGDLAWVGNGPEGTDLRVGVEYKKIDDLLQCMIDGRFVGHQMIGMLDNYDRRYLLVEGRIRTDRNTGVIQKQKGDRWYDIQRGGRGFTFRDLDHWFTTIEEMTQTRVAQTYDEYQSARWVVTRHSWYVNKGWDDHGALKQFHVPPPPTATFTKPGLLRRMAKELPSIGWDKSTLVAAKFGSVREMVNANEHTWREIDGIGPTIARRIIKELTNGR